MGAGRGEVGWESCVAAAERRDVTSRARGRGVTTSRGVFLAYRVCSVDSASRLCSLRLQSATHQLSTSSSSETDAVRVLGAARPISKQTGVSKIP